MAHGLDGMLRVQMQRRFIMIKAMKDSMVYPNEACHQLSMTTPSIPCPRVDAACKQSHSHCPASMCGVWFGVVDVGAGVREVGLEW